MPAPTRTAAPISRKNRPVLPDARLTLLSVLSMAVWKLPAMGAQHHRPALPEGPFLIVGLARSGQAAARLLAVRGEQVIGVDSGDPPGAAGLRDHGVEVLLDVDGVEPVERAASVIKSPGVPQTAPAIRAARRR